MNNKRTTGQAIKRHLPMMLKPAAVASIVVLVWYWMRSVGLHLDKCSEVPITAAVIPTLGMFDAIIAALVVSTVWEEYKKISVCVLQKDKITFLTYRDERIPVMIHLLLGAMSSFLLLSIMILDYEDPWTGVFSVFSIAYILTLYCIVAIELDDPKKSVWFFGRIPKEWLEADPDQEFGEKNLFDPDR